MTGPGFAIIDLETTGLLPSAHERVVEIAIVHADQYGTVTGQWETLVNPQRHVGAEHIHGIRAADLIDAPAFSDIADDVMELLSGRVMVAHNARFDRGFLTAEFGRTSRALPDDAPTLCTMQLARELIPGAGRSLADCCAAFDIALEDAHRAAVDARATAELLGGYIASTDREFWFSHIERALSVAWPSPVSPGASALARWVARGSSAASVPFLQRIAERMPDFSGPAEHVEYVALLDRCLIDRHLSEHESRQLVALAEELGIGRDTAASLHAQYFDQFAAVAWADGVLTSTEVADLAAVASLLQVPDARLTAALAPPVAPAAHAASTDAPPTPGAFTLSPGDAVVLTGEMSRPRADLEAALVAAGFRVASAISKKVALLVAADPDSLSGKARKAREYGIPVVGEEYLQQLL
ncbi:MAG: DNA polymerase III subunit epsilon [Leifsonia sp.]|uniref:exonuclease domain-containing protein n=1 Tax=Microcella indica TaxID=2750620 RepID=UPI000C436FC1|nr:exonuclease domain-containing protein [Microcella indica]MBR22106.1 DNA polymerase III subunit epsilon [Leifsonia sp.]